MTRTLRTVGIVLGGLLMAACGGGGGGGSGSPDGPDGPEPVAASLSRVADCAGLHDAINADARRKVEVQADELRAQGWIYSRDIVPPVGSPHPLQTPAAAPTPAAAEGGPPRDATDTNVQVPGVDEADIVETDGSHIYLLHEGALVILRSFPPEATAVDERVAIEGVPLGMFVAGGRALVLSEVYDTGELGGDDRCDGIGPPFPLIQPVDQPFGGVASPFVPPCQSSFVKLTLFDLTGEAARTVRELYVEGRYTAARRHGDRARVIVQREWGLAPGVPEPWQFIWSPAPPASEVELLARIERWEEEAIAAINASTLADWLPNERERIAGALVDRPLACENAHVTAAGLAQHGMSLIVGLDLTAEDGPAEDTLLMGRASQVYANGETLVLAHPDWQVEPMDDADSRTAIHVFTLPADSLATVYRGSGFVPGTLLSQFAIDAKNDVLRVATTFWSHERAQNVTRIVTARLEDDVLVQVGSTGDIAPGEQLFGARFLGDRAYLVTFLRIDPLFVVDVSDPAHPTVLGEVELPGFSEYLHPLGEHHLLTIGQDATPTGQVLGAALRIFDVSDPTAPRPTAQHALPSDGWTPAATNHLAFTFDTRLGLLALPFDGFFSDNATLILIGVDPATGFELRGEIGHGGESFAPCASPFDSELCPSYRQMLRGLFIDDFVYSISTDAVQAHALDDLTTPLATVVLP